MDVRLSDQVIPQTKPDPRFIADKNILATMVLKSLWQEDRITLGIWSCLAIIDDERLFKCGDTQHTLTPSFSPNQPTPGACKPTWKCVFKYVVIIFFIMTTLAENFGIFATSVSSKNVRCPRAYYTYIFSITKSTEPAVTSVNIIQVTESYGKPIMIGPK